MKPSTIPERLLTWLDVERVFKQVTALWTRMPPAVCSVRCFPDGADISYAGSVDAVNNWLASVFGRAFDSTNGTIHLRIGDSSYPLTLLVETAGDFCNSPVLPTYPLWREVAYLEELPLAADLADEAGSAVVLPAPWTDAPRIVSFHSFKGGVGRTTSLMTYVAARLEAVTSSPVKVLVVDADLEAPGVSFWLDEVNQPQVSFIQFLEAMHYPPVNVDSSLDHFASELRKTSLNVGGTQRELFVLPAAIDLTEILDMPVQPSHLASNPDNPWILADHLRALGQRLGVDMIFVDLRAGLSELASPLLFDPRVEHFFVTTVAAQSVFGMAEVLERLYTFNSQLPEAERSDAKPSVILSLLTPDLKRLPDYANALEQLGKAYPAADDQPMTYGVEWLEFGFSESLMSIGTLRQALEVLKQSSLFATAQEWAASSLPELKISQADAVKKSAHELSGKQNVQALRDVCERVQFAEKEMSSAMLVTDPLRNLGKHFSTELPNLVSVGAKGAGKTFTFLQVCKVGTWHGFLNRVGIPAQGVDDAAIFPVLWSESLSDTARKAVRQVQQVCLTSLSITQPPPASDLVQRQIKKALRTPPSHWDDFWAGLICRQFGLSGVAIGELNDKLVRANRSVVLVFDGLEDAFDTPSNEAARDAIQSLLKFSNRLAELPDRRIGVMVFVRADYVQLAIRQNVGQFLARFTPFQLSWNPESFLRLAYWLCGQADIIEADSIKAEELSVRELLQELEQLWGKKLGNIASKEAYSARWVFAALCDLKGNFQARDLVRFLRFAAEIETQRIGSSWNDRILAPESMRQAIPKCSVEKVDEASSEITFLREWRLRLNKAKITDRRVPFSADAMKLDTDQLIALRDLGVIYEDTNPNLGDERLYLPEIYRAGLGFETSASGRPRTMALLKKNLGSIPF